MACMTEALGLTLPGGAAIPAVDSRRLHLAEAAGRQIIELVGHDVRPSAIVRRDAFENAIRVLHAISGSTNAILHLTAYAGRVGVELPLTLFDELSATTPWLVDLKPAGQHLMEDFFYAGGLPAVLGQLRDLLHLDALTVTGKTLGENLDSIPTEIVGDVIRPRSQPLGENGSLVVLGGNLCPDGAVLKVSAADQRLLHHEGPALVFDDVHELAARIEDPDLDIGPDSVMVLRNAGPVGAPGMPEWGHLPIPTKLLRAGVTDLLRISDARMSGTSYGAIFCTWRRNPRSAVRWRSSRPATRFAWMWMRAHSTCSSTTPSSRSTRRMDAPAAQGRAGLSTAVRGARAAGERGLRPGLPARTLTRCHGCAHPSLAGRAGGARLGEVASASNF
jgi:dihydroxyacid dehydratase/phosphogluconate dehydratase